MTETLLQSEGPAEEIARILPELWISFVGLMRSHLAALQLTGKLLQATVVEASPSSLTLGDLNANITVSLPPNLLGLGTHQLRSCGGPNLRGTWQLRTDGTATVGQGSRQDMELAVELFARMLMAGQSEGKNL